MIYHVFLAACVPDVWSLLSCNYTDTPSSVFARRSLTLLSARLTSPYSAASRSNVTDCCATSVIDQVGFHVSSAAVIKWLLSWRRLWLTISGFTTSSPHLFTPEFHVVCQLLTRAICLYVFTFNPVQQISLLRPSGRSQEWTSQWGEETLKLFTFFSTYVNLFQK